MPSQRVHDGPIDCGYERSSAEGGASSSRIAVHHNAALGDIDGESFGARKQSCTITRGYMNLRVATGCRMVVGDALAASKR